MQLLSVEKRLNDVGYAHPQLAALQADDTQFTVLALQPEGRIRSADESIGHADPAAAGVQFDDFFGLVGRQVVQPDLVISPEYSVPWECLLRALESGMQPTDGKLWVLGCESLPLDGLTAVRARLDGSALVVDDDSSPVVLTTQRYRNPLVYVFKTAPLDGGQPKLILLVQYKTVPSGDRRDTEARGMLPGSIVYVFGRSPAEVRLISLICSDVFEFNKELIDAYYDGLLLLHIQLNNAPRHPIYKRYRGQLFEAAGRTELFCLNWAEHVHCDGEDWENIGGSAWYLLPKEFDSGDASVHDNHKHGVYYTRHEPMKVHALQFHYRPRAFLLQVTKVFHHAVAKPRSHRTGPKALKTFVWCPDCWRRPKTEPLFSLMPT